jgi:ArsR family transcriptional regulator, arsenate/arsenite/antimonite-responsive transcriptional repressor
MPLLAKSTDLDSTVEILKFLSDKNRLQLLIALSRAETCVCDLYDELDLAQNLVSYHLGKLKKAGLIRSRREGTWIYYSIDPEGWDHLIAPLASLLQLGSLPPEAAYGAGRRCEPFPAESI